MDILNELLDIRNRLDTLINSISETPAALTLDPMIDVSVHQGVIHWKAVKDAGVNLAYIRSSMGRAGVDGRFVANAPAAVSAGLHVGFYHLFRPEHEGAPQAEHFWNTVRSANGRKLRLAVDVELDGGDVGQPQNARTIAKRLADFIERMEKLSGEPVVIYTAQWFWNPKVDALYDALFSTCPLWVAYYGTETNPKPEPALPRGWNDWAIHQYTSSGKVNGIPGRVDLNRVRRIHEILR